MAKFTVRKKTRPIPRLEPRIVALMLFIGVVLAAAAVRLYYLQIIKHHELSELSDRNRIRIQRLPALRAPLLIIVGGDDETGSRPQSDSILARQPKARRVIVPRAGHMLSTERPSELAREIARFLASRDVANSI